MDGAPSSVCRFTGRKTYARDNAGSFFPAIEQALVHYGCVLPGLYTAPNMLLNHQEHIPKSLQCTAILARLLSPLCVRETFCQYVAYRPISQSVVRQLV